MAERNAADPIARTVYELTAQERDAAVTAYQRAHGEAPEWNIPSDRAWLEGYAAGRTDGVPAVDVPGERFLMAERLVEALADATTYPEQNSARAALMKHLREWANAGVAPSQARSWPAGLLDRVKAAEQRVQDNRAPRSIPADPSSDVDLVLAEVRYLIEGTWPPFWIKDASGVAGTPAPSPLTDAARVLAEFAKTAPGRLPQRVQDAIEVVAAGVGAVPSPFPDIAEPATVERLMELVRTLPPRSMRAERDAYLTEIERIARGVAVPRGGDALGTLEAALEWHRGDKWRAGTPTEAEAWRAQRERLEAAIEALRAGVMASDGSKA